MVTLITGNNFDTVVLKATEPVLIHFWSFTSPGQDPVLMQELGIDYYGRAVIGKMDADAIDNMAISANYGVNSVPTFLIFKGGQVVDRFVGASAKQTLEAALNKQLSTSTN